MDRVVTAAAVARVGGIKDLGPDEVQTWLLNPGIEIPERARQVHGISTQYAREYGISAAGGLEEINQRLAAQLRAGWPVIVFNAGYDLPLLAADSTRNNVATLAERLPGGVLPVLDPLVLDRALVPRRRGKRTLTDLCAAYDVHVPSGTHQAHVDAQITVQLLAAMTTRYPQLGDMGPAELDEFQRTAHANWARDLESWHASQGRQRQISATWF